MSENVGYFIGSAQVVLHCSQHSEITSFLQVIKRLDPFKKIINVFKDLQATYEVQKYFFPDSTLSHTACQIAMES
jgi:site-specific DNA-adenine methylase